MNVRCSYCRHSFNLNRDFMVQAVAEATEQRHKYVNVECINCRKQIKVPVSQMQRYLPRPEPSESES